MTFQNGFPLYPCLLEKGTIVNPMYVHKKTSCAPPMGEAKSGIYISGFFSVLLGYHFPSSTTMQISEKCTLNVLCLLVLPKQSNELVMFVSPPQKVPGFTHDRVWTLVRHFQITSSVQMSHTENFWREFVCRHLERPGA
jgi:hypothetical protein